MGNRATLFPLGSSNTFRATLPRQAKRRIPRPRMNWPWSETGRWTHFPAMVPNHQQNEMQLSQKNDLEQLPQ
jgi:hypothetical protein